MEAGHAGAAGRFEKLHQVALVHAFILLAHDLLEQHVLPAS
jgi:protease II